MNAETIVYLVALGVGVAGVLPLIWAGLQADGIVSAPRGRRRR